MYCCRAPGELRRYAVQEENLITLRQTLWWADGSPLQGRLAFAIYHRYPRFFFREGLEVLSAVLLR